MIGAFAAIAAFPGGKGGKEGRGQKGQIRTYKDGRTFCFGPSGFSLLGNLQEHLAALSGEGSGEGLLELLEGVDVSDEGREVETAL